MIRRVTLVGLVLSTLVLISSLNLPLGIDFSCFWTAGHMVLTGVASQVYDISAHAAAEVIRPDGSYTPFFYPPPFLLISIPFGLLPFTVGLIAFLVTTGAVYLWATTRVASWAWFPALAFPLLILNGRLGQNGMLTAGIIGAGLTLLDRRPRTAGLILGLMVIKPHLAFVLPIALLVSRRWHVMAYAALSAFVFCLVSGIILGWDTWINFFAVGSQAAKHLQGQVIEGHDLPTYAQSVFGLVLVQGGSLAQAYAAQIAMAIVAVAALIWTLVRGTTPAIERSLIVVCGLLVTPYVLYYDLLVLIFPCLWLMAEWKEGRTSNLGASIVALVFLAPGIHLALSIAFHSVYLDDFLTDRIVLLLYLVTASWSIANVDWPSLWFRHHLSYRRV